jgi:hypothetical protein
MLKGMAHSVVPRWLLSALPLAADLRLWSQCGGLQHASSKQVWALSISPQRRCRAQCSRSWLSPPQDAMFFQFFSRATHPPREIIVAHDVYMLSVCFQSSVRRESAREVESRSSGSMFADGSRLFAEMIYTGQSIFRPITGPY